MILTVDIGNTSIALGGFEADELKFVVRLSTDITKTEDEYASKIMNILNLYGVHKSGVDGGIISSVVPPLNAVMKNALRLAYGVEALMVSPGIKTGIGILCDSPSSVGADLICSCVAANTLYSAPSLIIDIGTATKMIVTNKNGAFIGVSIIPGVVMGLNALSNGTAQLPQVGLEAPPTVIGKNTVDCMKSGVIFGHASMMDGMIDRINREVGEELPVIVTGGYASVISPHCEHDMTIDEHLVLKGLNIIYNKNK
jgi:type III pantothenate kinase